MNSKRFQLTLSFDKMESPKIPDRKKKNLSSLSFLYLELEIVLSFERSKNFFAIHDL
jgi:hypothetical protein